MNKRSRQVSITEPPEITRPRVLLPLDYTIASTWLSNGAIARIFSRLYSFSFESSILLHSTSWFQSPWENQMRSLARAHFPVRCRHSISMEMLSLIQYYSLSCQKDHPTGRGYRTMLEQRDLRHHNGYRAPHSPPQSLKFQLTPYSGNVHQVSCRARA